VVVGIATRRVAHVLRRIRNGSARAILTDLPPVRRLEYLTVISLSVAADIFVFGTTNGLPLTFALIVFQNFHRAHPGAGYAGTGLGLAICKRIVERHGGTITATDNSHGGSRMSFTLPVAPQASWSR
jgi:light-regulated signal transduction histidine kinase (bacteriophytochrome)